MKTNKLAWGIVSTVALGIIIYVVKADKKNRLEQRLLSISDAGYETAHDILFPLKPSRFKRRFN